MPHFECGAFDHSATSPTHGYEPALPFMAATSAASTQDRHPMLEKYSPENVTDFFKKQKKLQKYWN
jgi:hypothetical protein